MATENLIKAVGATAELMGTELTADGARMFCADLAEYPEPAVLEALQKCRREHKGRLTLEAVLSHIPSGHPGAEEAWAMCPRSEGQTVVWTEEMSGAFFVALPILDDGDSIGARMAFKETYQRLVQAARDKRAAPVWSISLGHDASGRDVVIQEAHRLGRLGGPITAYLPHLPEKLDHDPLS